MSYFRMSGIHCSQCDRCRALLWWAVTANGRSMPVEPPFLPTDHARNVALIQDESGQLHARVLKKGETKREGERLTVAHFATCRSEQQSKATDRQAHQTLTEEGI